MSQERKGPLRIESTQWRTSIIGSAQEPQPFPPNRGRAQGQEEATPLGPMAATGPKSTGFPDHLLT